MTRPDSDDEDSEDEKDDEEEGDSIDKDKGLYKWSHGLSEGQELGVWGRCD